MRILLILIFCLIYGYQIVWSSSGLRRYAQIEKLISKEKAEMESFQVENQKLAKQIYLLNNDPFTIEYAIRRTYGYVQKDEIVLELLSSDSKKELTLQP